MNTCAPLGRDHRKFRVESVHFGMIGQALIDSLRAFAGERWSPAYEQAWQDAYRVIARKMLTAAQEDTNPPFWHAEIVSHERRARDIAVFTCRTMQPLPYRAGQYVSIESDRQPRVWRVYSMANSPRPDNTMDFHIRAVGAGWLSGALVRRAEVGDMIRIAAPMGSMTVDPASTRDIVCVAGGTGLAPIKAIIDEIGQTNRTRWVHLFFGARDREDLYDLDDLMQLTTRYPWLTVTPVTSEDPTYPGERGNVSDCDGRLRTMERPRRVRLRIARHGPGDAAAAVRDPGPINPYQVRRLRRPVIKPLTKPVTEPMTIAMTEPLTEPCSHPVTSESGERCDR